MRFSRSRLRLLAPLAVLVVAAGAAAAAINASRTGRIGISRQLTGNGRHLTPAGRLVTLGQFPTGGAVTPDGRFLWTVSTGRALNDIRIIALTGRPHVVQVLPIPGASGGITIDRYHPTVYVSGVADSSNADEKRTGLPALSGDAIHVYAYNRRTGRAVEGAPIPVPAPSGAPAPQNFPPAPNGKHVAWPDRLALSPGGSTLLVPLNLADAAAVVDTRTRQVRYVATGAYPYGAAILPDGRTGLVSNEGPGTVSVINLRAGTKTTDIQVGANVSHPEAIAIDPRRPRAYVAVANADQVAVIDTRSMTVASSFSVEQNSLPGESPVALTVSPDGRRLYVAEAGADQLAVYALPSQKLIGRIPTAAYPADVQAVGRRLTWIAAKGFGSGPNVNGANPLVTTDDNLLIHPGTAVLTNGRAGVLAAPTDAQIRRLTPAAARQLTPANREAAPAGTPLRPNGPIKHVFYIVRENRTYDQILGDDPRGDGMASMALFGKSVTPNFHALVQRFPLVDHLYANSEASIDGHFWTSAANVSDYVHKNWQQNYASRGRPYDFGVYSITWPGTGFLFDRAQQQGISYYNFGEAIAGTVPLTSTDKDNTQAQTNLVNQKFANSDLGAGGVAPGQCYPNDASIGTDAINKLETYDSSPPSGAPLTAESRFNCFRTQFNRWVATGSVPSFTYLVLPNDHTQGLSVGARSPRSMVAENDLGLGQIVSLISSSPIWSSSAVFVLEDDSQDGADHVDAHRMPAAVISPYAKRGAVIHTRYDMLSVIRSMELILGMRPLSLGDALATPMYDLFTPRAENGDPYAVVAPTYPLLQRNPNTALNRRLSRGYNWTKRDAVPQDVFDSVLWKAVHGPGAQAPPPGPNAVRGQ